MSLACAAAATRNARAERHRQVESRKRNVRKEIRNRRMRGEVIDEDTVAAMLRAAEAASPLKVVGRKRKLGGSLTAGFAEAPCLALKYVVMLAARRLEELSLL